MVILAFDTCLDVCSVALMQTEGDHETVICHTVQMERGHAEHLAPMIREVMAQAGLEYQQLDRLAVTIGPGSFTGVRLGVALLRGMNISLQKPIVATTSLHLLAHGFVFPDGGTQKQAGRPSAFRPVVVVQDARRGQFYVQPFLTREEVEGGSPAQDVQLVNREDMSGFVAKALAGLTLTQPDENGAQAALIGSGVAEVAGLMKTSANHLDFITKKQFPAASALASIAQNAHTLDQKVSPLYLRAADAKPQTGKRLKRQV